MSDLDDMDIRQYDELDMQEAAEYQRQLDERRQKELRTCTDRGRIWLVSDELPPINWSEPF